MNPPPPAGNTGRQKSLLFIVSASAPADRITCLAALMCFPGTCCETLLMVQAYQKNIVFPNKQVEQREKFYNNHLLESETYIGGHVDAIRSGMGRFNCCLLSMCTRRWPYFR